MGPESQTHVQKYAHMKMKKNEPMQDVIQNGRFDQFGLFDQGKLYITGHKKEVSLSQMELANAKR